MGVSSLLGIGGVMDEIKGVASMICTIVLAICAVMITIVAIWIGFRLSTAEDDNKRKEAKMHLIYAIIGLIITVSVAALTSLIGEIEPGSAGGTGSEVGDEVVTAIADGVGAILNIVTAVASVFAVYIGWQFVKAEDEGKRKQAKAQLIWTLIGIVSVFLVNSIGSTVIASLT
jgi:heme O synthase-like polyprenyltransferase